MGRFTINDRSRQRQYAGKLFYFERLLVYTESDNLQQRYRGHFLSSKFGISEYDANKKFCLFAGKSGEQVVEFQTSVLQLKEWYDLLYKLLMDFANTGKIVKSEEIREEIEIFEFS
jgi:hypothetical protein